MTRRRGSTTRSAPRARPSGELALHDVAVRAHAVGGLGGADLRLVVPFRVLVGDVMDGRCTCETPKNTRTSAKCGRCGLVIDLMARLEDSLRRETDRWEASPFGGVEVGYDEP